MKKDEIKDSAFWLFSNKGYNGSSVKEIADLAGINKATLYYYFKSKEDLYLEILGETGDFLH
jgi:AcrR family transcriptional regulator